MAKAVREVRCASMFKGILKDLVGESALAVLEHQLSKRLAEAEPFELLLIDPKRFYDALGSIIGPGAAYTLLKLLFKQVANKHKLTCFQADEFITALTTGEKSIREQISKLFQEICKTGNT